MGINAGIEARKRVRLRQQEKEEREEKELDKLIEETAKTSAL